MKPVCVIGPTASGKSEVAMVLAQRLEGEIVSVDSMQVYRGMDIGTAKPEAAARAQVPHHLIDVCGVDEPFDAARFVRDADAAIVGIETRGQVPVLCGGTGFYLKAWLEGLGQSPSSDPDLRKELESTPVTDLLAELARRDPESYARIDRQNPRRIVRAIEVIRQTGRPFSEQRADWTQGESRDVVVIGLRREATDLRERIDRRVDAMFEAGLVDEVRMLLAQGLEQNRTAAQAIGYRQVIEHLRGERDLAATITLVKTRTWQFARRQMTWFRNQLTVAWMDIERDMAAAAVAHRIVDLVIAADVRKDTRTRPAR